MKIINATWEKRNLGCDAYEIQIERKDLKNFSEVMAELKKQDFSGAYVTVKMPVGNLEALHALEDDGFRFMETQYHLRKDLSDYETPVMLIPYVEQLKRVEIEKNREKWQEIVDMITPEMFTTDRIYLDPLLSYGTSCKRYKNWMMDLVEKSGVRLFIVKDNDDVIAYSLEVWDMDKKVVNALLGGVFEKYQKEGYGLLSWDNGLRYYKKNKVSIDTDISSNNQAVFDVYMFFDYKITKQTYVLRKKFEEGRNDSIIL